MSNITKLYLLNAPLEADYKHTFYFATKQAQETYFKSCKVGSAYSYEDFSYQRKDNKIRFPKQFDEINGRVNYVMYQNSAYSDKWFYAFIVDIQYINDGATDIYISTDVMQTWMFDYKLKSCFVEREHTDNDEVGANTIPEGLETGEYICNQTMHDRTTQHCGFVVASTVDISTGEDTGIKIYNNVINGWKYYYFSGINEIENVLGNIAELRTNDAIVSIFVAPAELVNVTGNEVNQSYVVNSKPFYDIYSDDTNPDGKIFKPTSLNGYYPHNKKLLTYPYCYLLMDNNSGASSVYHYELFNYSADPNECPFNIYYAITPSGSLKLIPIAYGGVAGENNNHSLPGGKYPICGWQSDYYTNWLTQNALNIEVQTKSIELAGSQTKYNSVLQNASGALNSGIDLGTNIANGNGVGAAKNVIGIGTNFAQMACDLHFASENQKNQIQGITAQKEIHAFQSPTVGGNTNTGDVNYVMGTLRFSGYHMSIKEEYARIIDNYFAMYGYQVNRVKIPNKDHRRVYWYTKTVGCEIDGAIPNKDIEIIKGCYNSGITFWRANLGIIGEYTNSSDDLIYNNIV